jgi:ABC-type transport system involved in multi-copper enzyme maturation permease subunit
MLANVARFEFRYLLRNPLLWVTAALTFALFFVSMSVDGFELGSEGGLLRNAAYATLRDYLVVSVLFMFVTASFVANVIIRDDETGFGPIVRSTPITRFEYLIGRFLGAFAAAALCLLVVPLAIWLGSLMPWADPTTLGPNRLIDHLYGYFLLALPNLFISSAILFALATITRSMMATYLGVIGFVSAFFTLANAFGDRPQLATAVAIADPFGGRALRDATRYWTVAERNAILPDLSGALLSNRLLWIAISLLCLALAYAAYRFADQGMSKRERKQQQLARRASAEAPRLPLHPSDEATSLPSPRHGPAALRALLWMRTRFEMKQVVVSPAFAILMAWGLFVTFFVLITQRDPAGRPSYPSTLRLIPKLEDAFYVIPLIIAIYYAGELVWRERDRRVHELVDASPMPNWAYVVPKTLAMGLVLLATLLTTVVASVIVQLSLGYPHLELDSYLLWYVLPRTWDMLLLAALAVFVQAISPRKAIGWGVMVLFLLWQQLNTAIDHKLLNYGATTRVPLSDLNGAGSFWIDAWTFRLYWGAFALLLLIAAHLLWRRGTEIRLKPRLALARRRLAGASGRVASAALLAFLATGAWAYYNTNILNRYQTRGAADGDAAELEKRYWNYHDLPQPTMAEVTLDVALYPEERRAVTKGRALLRNLTAQTIADIHLRLLDPDLVLTSATIGGARLILEDARYDYRIYRLDSPMRPGDERLLTFTTRRWQRGFPNGSLNTTLIENGTFLTTTDFMPVLGMSRAGTLHDRATRRRYGLPEELPTPKLEDLSTTAHPDLGAGWTKADITVSTSADQTPIAQGRRVSDVTRGGRRTARFVSETPILLFFSVQSARYAERHRRHAGVDLAVYYHPGHEWNVDRMLDALAASLDYDQANFGPYPFDHVRLVEFPGYLNYAQAFAGTIAFSEAQGFVADYRDPETIDQVTLTTAHELAHQYWAHQVIGAGTEGSALLSEGLAQYSAMMVAEQLYGGDAIRRPPAISARSLPRGPRPYRGGGAAAHPRRKPELAHPPQGSPRHVPAAKAPRRGRGQPGAADAAEPIQVQGSAVPPLGRPDRRTARRGRNARTAGPDHRPLRARHPLRPESHKPHGHPPPRRPMGRDRAGRGEEALRDRQRRRDRDAPRREHRSRPLHRRARPRRLPPIRRNPDGAPPDPLRPTSTEVRQHQEADLRRRRSLQLLHRQELGGQRGAGEVKRCT